MFRAHEQHHVLMRRLIVLCGDKRHPVLIQGLLLFREHEQHHVRMRRSMMLRAHKQHRVLTQRLILLRAHKQHHVLMRPPVWPSVCMLLCLVLFE